MRKKLRLYSVLLLIGVSLPILIFGESMSETTITKIYIFTFFIILSLWLISFFVDNSVKSIEKEVVNINNDDLLIPDVCPHCKNPNSKRVRLCEWCGSQII